MMLRLFLEYLLISLFIAPFSLRFARMDKKGSLSAFFLGLIVYLSVGFKGFLLLFALHLIGALVTRTGHMRKEKKGLDQRKRSYRNVLANGFFPALGALLSAVQPERGLAFLAAYSAAVAAATADTVSSELGELSRNRPRLLTNLREVDTGTDGAISILGTFSGFCGSALIGLMSVLLLPIGGSVVLLIIITASGFLGMIVDSLLGATLEQKGYMGNDLVNLFATGSGFTLAILFYALL